MVGRGVCSKEGAEENESSEVMQSWSKEGIWVCSFYPPNTLKQDLFFLIDEKTKAESG